MELGQGPVVKQIPGRYAKCRGYPDQESQGRVLLSSFDASEIAHSHARLVSKRFLAEPFGSAQTSNVFPDSIFPPHRSMRGHTGRPD